MHKFTILIFCLLALTYFKSSGQAANEADTLISMPQVEVLGKRDNGLFKDVPGSVTVISPKEIQSIAPVNTSDVLRKVAGLNIVDEDGASLRLNIGVRGLNPIRSSKVLVLEDGIPVTLNPYGEPQMYFSPLMDKMQEVEVLKGSGQLLFGPQTIGGVVNFITANPTAKPTTRVKASGGRGGFFSGYTSHSNTIGNVGYIVTYNHKRADNLGALDFTANDISGKISIRFNERSDLGLKFGYYDELSNSTYIGLTQALYDAGGNDFTQLAPNDYMPVSKTNFSATHRYRFSEKIRLETTAYAYNIIRNWRRQAFDRSPVANRAYDKIWGDPTAADGSSLFMRTNADWRDRQYQVRGLEPKLTVEHKLFNVENSLKTGVRLLTEQATEQFVQSVRPNGWGGTMRDNEVRKGVAVSVYAVNDIQINDKLSANVGFRVENFDFNRRIYRGQFNINGATVVRDTNLLISRNTLAFLPGVGLNYNANSNISIFAGVHKGFAPPVVKSAITANGVAENIDKEESTNYELGARVVVGNYFQFSPTLFHMDFKNQVVPVTLATGASGSADGGKSRHTGIEFAADFDLAKALGRSSSSVAIGGTFTYVDARFTGKQEVVDNFLPYSPKVIVNHYISAELKNGLGIRFSGIYTGDQYNDINNTVVPAKDGQVGLIGSRYILEGNLWYTFKKNFTINIAGKNLTNERYIVSRNPQGIRVGLDRFITAGIDFRF
jgi:Fe(3+) dicitrate transport protein